MIKKTASLVGPEPVGIAMSHQSQPTAEKGRETVAKRSAVEGIKEASKQLRGTIQEELASQTDHFNDENKQLLKFHGSYQQEDRDARKNRQKDGVGKHFMFMVRCRIPAGKLTAQQYLAMDKLAGTYANGTLRFTTRQGIQLHGVLKDNLRDTIAGINECLLTTLGACGDVERNVMACPAPHHQNGVRAQLQETAYLLAVHLAPRSRAYHEIWINGKRAEEAGSGSAGPPDIEPLYGKVYLPRKFKTGLALPEDNCIDVHAQDLGLLAIVEGDVVKGYNVLVGGGMGMTHGNASTFPHLAQPICYVPASAVIGAAEAVVRLFRDHGNRADRKRARIKYLVHDWGVEKFRQVLAEYVGGTLLPPRPIEVRGFDPHHGWQDQGDGRWFYGLSIENGRVKDEGTLRLRSGLRTLVERFEPGLRITPQQDILLCNLDGSTKSQIEQILAEHGVRRPDQLANVRKFSLACPAIPTCGLALTESERVLPKIIDQIEAELARLGLTEEKLSVRMTGCPNGCARPYQSDIGLVGRSGDKYTVYVGGTLLGNRLNFQLKDLVPFAELVPTLRPILEHFKSERQGAECFGDFCHRIGVERLRQWLPRSGDKPLGITGIVSRALAATPKEAIRGQGVRPATNGNGLAPGALAVGAVEDPRLAGGASVAEPKTSAAILAMPAPEVTGTLPMTAKPVLTTEVFLAGALGEERPDYTYRYHPERSVRNTVVHFYENDQRAGQAPAGASLRREAIYDGRVDAYRLHAARKISDTFLVGPAGAEIRDTRVEYDLQGQVARTIVFFYEGDVRAADAQPSAPLRRQAVYAGLVASEKPS
jgi:sulfite reductase (ferredoxin)